MYERGLVVGIQDLGGAGISCATSECAANGGMGIDVDLDAVHLREHDMTPAEILMSESQERMLAFIEPSDLVEVQQLTDKWEIESSVIGTVVPGGRSRFVPEVRSSPRSLPPRCRRTRRSTDVPASPPTDLAAIWEDQPNIPDDIDVPGALLALLDDPAIGDKSWIYEQYDHQLFLNTIVEPGHDGALLRIKGTSKGLAVSDRRGWAPLPFGSTPRCLSCGLRSCTERRRNRGPAVRGWWTT